MLLEVLEEVLGHLRRRRVALFGEAEVPLDLLPVQGLGGYFVVEAVKTGLHNNVIIKCFRMCNWSFQKGIGQRLHQPSHFLLEVLLAVRRLEKPPHLHTA